MQSDTFINDTDSDDENLIMNQIPVETYLKTII